MELTLGNFTLAVTRRHLFIEAGSRAWYIPFCKDAVVR